MKVFRFTLMVLLFLGFTMQPGIAQEWTEEIQLELRGAPETIVPDMDIDPNTGHLHIVSMISPHGVLYTEMDKDGNVIQQSEVPVAAVDNAYTGNIFGATIAVDPQGRPHICFRDQSGELRFDTFYSYWNGTEWTAPVTLSTQVERGYMIRMDIDAAGKAHIARGSMANKPGENLIGPVKYFRIMNGAVENTLDNIYRFRADDRLEIDASYQNQVHLLLGCPDYPAEGGPLWYWRSFDGGDTWTQSDIHHEKALGANGAPDIFVDASGNVHIVYGCEIDRERKSKRSVRYARFTNHVKQRDLPVTEVEEILYRYDTPQGIGSVAASNDGQIVMVLYSENFDERLFTRESHDGGATWSDRTFITSHSCTNLGRNRQIIRAWRDRFYALYPTQTGVKLRIKKFSINHPPVADVGGPYTGNEGAVINFDASKTTDQDGNISRYEWDFQNDGVWDQTTTTPQTSFTYDDDFNGQVKIQVTDLEHEASTALANVTIRNLAPTAVAGGPYLGNIGSVITFRGNGTDPGADVLTYSWDLNGDGVYETPGQNTQQAFTTVGIFTVSLKVTDDDGGVGTAPATVTIQSLPPVIANIIDQTINEGGSFTPINLDAAVTDPDHADNQITWSFLGMKNLTIAKQQNFAKIAVVNAEWNGSEALTFVATDPNQKVDSAQVKFTVLPVNDPPQVKSITVPAVLEGSTFAPLSLDQYVVDPDNPVHEIVWKAQGQVQIDISINSQTRSATFSIPNADWFGTETVTFTATDNNGTGLSASTQTQLTVQPVNDPPVIHGNPGQTVLAPRDFTPVLLDTLVSDVDHPVTDMRWTFANNDQLTVTITNRVLTVQKPRADWIGTDDILLTVSDGQASAQVTALFTMLYHNDPPKISSFQGETIPENGVFHPINLDEKVADPDHADGLLSWSVTGNSHLIIDGLAQHLVHLAVADSEWSGSETFRFKVTDPGGLQDSAVVTFTVTPINDAPRFQLLPDFTFAEETTLTLTSAQLQQWVFDPDDDFSVLSFSISQNLHTQAVFETGTGEWLLSAVPNWSGSESVRFTVQDDQSASSSKTVQIHVTARPDPPQPFDLLEPTLGYFYETEPRSVHFTWQRAFDPDQNDRVTYLWKISRHASFDPRLDQSGVLTDTTFTYTFPATPEAGFYFWQVFAMDLTGHIIPSRAHASFIVKRIVDVETGIPGKAPTEFALLPNHPNPFNPETQLTYHLPRTSQVRVRIYNSLGQAISTLVDQVQPAGIYTLYWNGKDDRGERVSGGIYIAKLETEHFCLARKMLFLP